MTLGERLLTLLAMPSPARAFLGFSCLFVALATLGCGARYRPMEAHDVAVASDPNATYGVVLDTLKNDKYELIDQDATAHVVHVKSHVDQHDPAKLSIIAVQVDGGGVHLSASGYHVHPDGTIYRNLNSELATLQKAFTKRLGAGPAGAAGPANANPAGLPPPPNAPPGSLPMAWSEPAYDPSVWGHGNFTCLPVKIPADQQSDLTLKLTNGENADVMLSLAYAPELCRSPGECKLAGGCPALGIGDTERVSRLAGRLSKNEIGPQATLLLKGQPVAVIDLSKHGSIAQAMTETKH
ncbi:MAG TPA: hypothetical protein VHV51_24450 [Polyangiaceae bacterium]|nr:hypothetical protein [Polyangiaceae bacterium]